MPNEYLLPYTVHVRILWRNGEMIDSSFFTFEEAFRYCESFNESIDNQENIHSITIDCILT